VPRQQVHPVPAHPPLLSTTATLQTEVALSIHEHGAGVVMVVVVTVVVMSSQ
jgi:hypothetical protein